MSYKFSGLIKCLDCGKNYRGKMERKKPVYICSGFSNYGSSFCKRFQINEEEIEYTISKHLAIVGKSIKGEIREYIKIIEVKDRGYTIYYKDGSKSIINSNDEYGIQVKY